MEKNPYIEDIYSNKNKAINLALDRSKDKFNASIGSLGDSYKQKNRVAFNSYLKDINPYGLKKEKLYASGLSNSYVQRQSDVNNFSKHQNEISANYNDYKDKYSLENEHLLDAQLRADQERLSNLSEYNKNLYDEYVRLEDIERQRKRQEELNKQWLKDYQLRVASSV